MSHIIYVYLHVCVYVCAFCARACLFVCVHEFVFNMHICMQKIPSDQLVLVGSLQIKRAHCLGGKGRKGSRGRQGQKDGSKGKKEEKCRIKRLADWREGGEKIKRPERTQG
jgi:hypothetical protein